MKKVKSRKCFQPGHDANVANLASYINRQLIKSTGNRCLTEVMARDLKMRNLLFLFLSCSFKK